MVAGRTRRWTTSSACWTTRSRWTVRWTSLTKKSWWRCRSAPPNLVRMAVRSQWQRRSESSARRLWGPQWSRRRQLLRSWCLWSTNQRLCLVCTCWCCLSVCLLACLCVCPCACMCIHADLCGWGGEWGVCTCTHVSVYVFVCVCVCVCVCVWVPHVVLVWNCASFVTRIVSFCMHIIMQCWCWFID